ncbi:MAG: hypothetical protein C5B50_17205 [Verrucomicrobia bacterium]|nr:MAG: hypothetical protein C5B50_17205 [Verrucomicrobiota bacterium]
MAQASDTRPSSAAGQGHRWLLIVETSQAMQRRAAGTLDAVNTLLRSGMKGQLRAGDSLGIWTFNDELHAGKFPLQTWAPDQQNSITSLALDFLKSQKCEKTSTLSSVVPGLKRLIQKSDLLTIVLVSTGSEKFEGTPFDKEIAEAYSKWMAAEQKKKMPFVTVLRARQGQVIGYSVTPIPWPLEMPVMPEEIKAAPVVATSRVPAKTPPRTVAAPPAAPRVLAQPLIVYGRKDEESGPSAASANPALPVIQTNSPATTPSPAPAISAARVAPPDQETDATTVPAPNAQKAKSAGWRLVSPAFLLRASLWLIGLGAVAVVAGALTMMLRRNSRSSLHALTTPEHESAPSGSTTVTIGPAVWSSPRGVRLQARPQ